MGARCWRCTPAFGPDEPLIAWVVAAWAGRYAMDDNHPEWRWRTLDTETARIHFPVGRDDLTSGAWTASRVAEHIDPLWNDLCAALEIRCQDRLDIVILEDTDALEGFTVPSADWVVFSGHPGAELARMRGRADWVPDLLAHELAHVAMERRTQWLPKPIAGLGVDVGGVAETGSAQIGGVVTITDGQPYWFSEGSAEFWSEQVGVNRWTSARDRLLATSAEEGRLSDPARWGAGALLDDWRDGERAYQQGYAFLRWLADREGVGAIRELCARSGRPRRVWDRVFDDVFGIPLVDLLSAFEDDVRRSADARRARVEAEGRVEGRELSLWPLEWEMGELAARDRWRNRTARERLLRRERTGTLHLHASWSADGRWFARQRGSWLEVREVDPSLFTVFAGRTPDRLRTREQRARYWRHAAWFPTSHGSRFAFVPGSDALIAVDQVRADAWFARGRREWNQLFWVDLAVDGAGEDSSLGAGALERRRRRRPLANTERGFDPAVSPDGRRLAFVRYEDGGTNLFVLDLRTEHVERWTQLTGVWLEAPSWSPDGSALVATRHSRSRQDLVVIEPDNLTVLHSTPWEEVDPFWAADGSIWFAADPGGIHDIYRRDATGRVARMTRVVSGAQSPRLTPDGHLVYSHFTSFGWKSKGLVASEWAWEDATALFIDRPTEDPAPVVDVRRGRPYRAATSLLPLGISPRFRLDRTAAGDWLPRVGAFVRVRDAVENHTLSLDGWVGGDRGVEGRYTWHGVWPDLSLSAGVARTHLEGEASPRTLTGLGAGARLPLRGHSEVGVRLQRLEVSGPTRHRTTRLVSDLHLGDGAYVGHPRRTGEQFALHHTLGFSGGDPFTRVEVELQAVSRAPVGGSSGHRVVLGLQGAWTDRVVAAEDDLWIGGDHPDAQRPGRVETTAPLVGYAPYSVRARHFGIVGLGWRVPLATRLGQRTGPVVVDQVTAELGGDLGLTEATTLLDGWARLRTDGIWAGRRLAVAFTVAHGLPTAIGHGGWRTSLAVGSGF